MKTQYDNWDCEGSRRGVTKFRRRIGWCLLVLAILVFGMMVVQMTGFIKF